MVVVMAEAVVAVVAVVVVVVVEVVRGSVHAVIVGTNAARSGGVGRGIVHVKRPPKKKMANWSMEWH